ncbi:MAG: uracil-DNA glycosylase [Beijerinckiaceae bacterium]|nr:uracil-DNA glycosylase [Beijerinckiaceae bacterium]
MPVDQNSLEPSHNCPICPRLVAFREAARSSWPEWHNGPVPSFGVPTAQLLIVGLAPGLKGANRTGRPFTGDYAGDLLYSTLIQFGFAKGQFAARPDDGLELVNCLITNAVRCVPPENKPTPAEIAACRPFLINTIAAMPALRGILALGKISHDSVLRALGLPLSAYKFTHGAQHAIGDLIVYDSYHCSRYNTNTGVLTTKMFQDVFAAIRRRIPQN